MKIGIYARVSTTDQDCTQQLAELRHYVAARGWTVEGEYVDNGHSGVKDSRPAMNRLMAAARVQRVDAIVVWKIDRWGRSMPQFVSSVQELRNLGVRFISVTQGIDTDESNPTSKLMLNLLVAFSEFERELIVERTRAGLARARKEGRIGGRPRLVLDRDRIAALDADGFTVREIAGQMGVSAATVCRMLKAHRRPEPYHPAETRPVPAEKEEPAEGRVSFTEVENYGEEMAMPAAAVELISVEGEANGARSAVEAEAEPEHEPVQPPHLPRVWRTGNQTFYRFRRY